MVRSLLLFCVLGSVLGCNGGKKGDNAPADPGNPTVEGIVRTVTGSATRDESLPEGKGSVLLDLVHTDRTINQKVKLTLVSADGTEVGRGEGAQDFTLPPGSYDARLEYSEGPLASGFTGGLKGMKVSPGHRTRYQVMVAADIGVLKLRFTDGAGGVSEKVHLAVFREEDDPDLASAVWEGSAAEGVVLPKGAYQVRADFQTDTGLPIVEWYRGLQVDGAMARTERDIAFDLVHAGIRVDAFNFSKDINERTRVYLYVPGADMQFAVARFQGQAGEVISADPDKYDVRVVYTPSSSAMDFVAEKRIPDVNIVAGGGVRMQVDMEKPLALIRVKLRDKGEDVSEKVEFRVLRTGADPDASAAVIDDVAGGTYPVPVGTYDVYLRYKPADGEPRSQHYPSIELGNGFAWVQEFDAAAATWDAVAVRKPIGELKPITVRPPVVTGGDDDDSAATPATPPGATQTPPAAPQ